MLKRRIKRWVFSFDDLAAWNKGRYDIVKEGNYPAAILFAESHERPGSMLQDQLELISTVRPDFVLHEFMDGLIYDPETKTEVKMPNRRYDHIDLTPGLSGRPPEEILKLSDEMKFRVVGCDLTNAEEDIIIRQLYRRDPSLRRRGGVGLTQFDPEIMIFRDNKAAQIARMYVGQTKNPVPVIMGEDHIHNIHERQLLKVIVGYAYLRPI